MQSEKQRKLIYYNVMSYKNKNYVCYEKSALDYLTCFNKTMISEINE